MRIISPTSLQTASYTIGLIRCQLLPAGHAAALLSDALYIVGGGNNSAGCADLMSLDLGGLATGQPLAWSSVAKAEPRSAIASEGVSSSHPLAFPTRCPCVSACQCLLGGIFSHACS